jgi:hypothetical protein
MVDRFRVVALKTALMTARKQRIARALTAALRSELLEVFRVANHSSRSMTRTDNREAIAAVEIRQRLGPARAFALQAMIVAEHDQANLGSGYEDVDAFDVLNEPDLIIQVTADERRQDDRRLFSLKVIHGGHSHGFRLFALVVQANVIVNGIECVIVESGVEIVRVEISQYGLDVLLGQFAIDLNQLAQVWSQYYDIVGAVSLLT